MSVEFQEMTASTELNRENFDHYVKSQATRTFTTTCDECEVVTYFAGNKIIGRTVKHFATGSTRRYLRSSP